MSAFAILLNGELTVTERLQRQLAGRRVIAADGGMRHALALGLTPELWLGDFDSIDASGPTPWQDVPRMAFPQAKDRTDGELATETARERGASDLLLVGAFGGARTDHAMLHAIHALQLAREGLPVMLSDGRQEACPVLPGAHEYDLPQGTLFSLIGFSALAGLSISGARWPLSDRAVPFGSSLTLSNVVTGRLHIELAKGKALLIVTTGA